MLVNVYHHHLHRNWQPQTQRHAYTHRNSCWLEPVRLVFFLRPLCLGDQILSGSYGTSTRLWSGKNGSLRSLEKAMAAIARGAGATGPIR